MCLFSNNILCTPCTLQKNCGLNSACGSYFVDTLSSRCRESICSVLTTMWNKKFLADSEGHSPILIKYQFISVTRSCLTLCDPMDRSTPGLSVHHQLPEFTQTQVHWVSDAIQPSYPLSSPFPPAFSLSQHQGLFRWVSCSHQVAKVLEFQLQHQFFQCIFRTDLL